MSLLSADAAEANAPPSVGPTPSQAPTRWELLAQLEKTAIGTRSRDGSATVRRGEMAGCLLFGPYWHFSVGVYRLDFRCAARRPLLLQQPVAAINSGIAPGSTNRKMLPAPIPIYVVYQTAFLGSAGALSFAPDLYQRDEEIWRHLQPLRQAPVAQREQPAPRRG